MTESRVRFVMVGTQIPRKRDDFNTTMPIRRLDSGKLRLRLAGREAATQPRPKAAPRGIESLDIARD